MLKLASFFCALILQIWSGNNSVNEKHYKINLLIIIINKADRHCNLRVFLSNNIQSNHLNIIKNYIGEKKYLLL